MNLSNQHFKELLASDRSDGLPPLVNIGVGEDLTIKELAELISQEVNYNGSLKFNHTKPDGTMRKLMDVSLMNSLGWTASKDFREGLVLAYKNYLSNLSGISS